MDIELTSARDDGSYTWRAAGARQPRGLVPISMLPPSSKVGDILRAEVEIELDGITVRAILPPKQKHEESSSRIEHIGPPRQAPGVTTVLAGSGDRGDGRRRDGQRRDGERGGHGQGGDRVGQRDGRRRDGERGGHGQGGDRGRTSEGREPRPGDGESRPRGGERTRGEAGGRSGRDERRERTRSSERPGGPGRGRPREHEGATVRGGGRRVPPRFEPGSAHRDELFATLTPEQRRVAERLASGGLPAVRKAIAEEQQRAREEGRLVVSGEQLVALAEQLLPDVKAAVWLDRAEAAVARLEEITLRDLRMTVVGATPRDDAGRELERTLREALDKRVTKLRQDWEQHLAQALDDGRVLQALRLSAKPPEPTARFPAALVMRLAEAAGDAMTADTAPDRWLSLLEAAVQCPVRRQVRPAGIPKDPSGETERQARLAASRVPALGRLLGMAIPPPPHAAPGNGPSRRPHRQQAQPAEPPRPDEPARPAEPAEPTASAGGPEPPRPPESAEPAPGAGAPIGTEPAQQPSEDRMVGEERSEAGNEG